MRLVCRSWNQGVHDSLKTLHCAVGTGLGRIPKLFPRLTAVGLTLRREYAAVDVSALAKLPHLQSLAIFGEVGRYSTN